jgi:hypothetical protein
MSQTLELVVHEMMSQKFKKRNGEWDTNQTDIPPCVRGDFKQSEYGKVILPFVVMRRLDCILEASKQAVLKAAKGLPEGVDDATRDMILYGAVGGNIKVYNLNIVLSDAEVRAQAIRHFFGRALRQAREAPPPT